MNEVKRGIGRELDGTRHVARVGLQAVLGSAFRLRFTCLENVPHAGGAVLASNHVSVLDPLVIGIGAARRGRALRYVALSEDFRRPGVGWGLRLLDQIPIRRGSGDWAAIEEIAAAVRGGSVVGISAEGTVGGGAKLLPLQKGAARVALAARAPVLPVGIWGTQLRWARSGPRLGLPIRPEARVVYGRPIEPEGDARSRADVRALTDRIAIDLEALVERARGVLGDGSFHEADP